MKRSLVAVLATLALVLGLSASASATTANPHASCNGLVAASRAGDAQAQSNVVHDVIAEAMFEGRPPGSTFGDFAHFHDQTAEVCLD